MHTYVRRTYVRAWQQQNYHWLMQQEHAISLSFVDFTDNISTKIRVVALWLASYVRLVVNLYSIPISSNML